MPRCGDAKTVQPGRRARLARARYRCEGQDRVAAAGVRRVEGDGPVGSTGDPLRPQGRRGLRHTGREPQGGQLRAARLAAPRPGGGRAGPVPPTPPSPSTTGHSPGRSKSAPSASGPCVAGSRTSPSHARPSMRQCWPRTGGASRTWCGGAAASTCTPPATSRKLPSTCQTSSRGWTWASSTSPPPPTAPSTRQAHQPGPPPQPPPSPAPAAQGHQVGQAAAASPVGP